MNTSPSRVAIVGCGGVARVHVRAMGAATVVGLCDANPEAALKLRSETGISAPVYASFAELLEAATPATVLVCTPPATHFGLVKVALEVGANVLCEKPLATRATDAATLVALAEERGAKLRTSAKYRFCAGAEAAKSLIASGEAGAIQSLDIAFGGTLDWAQSWHSNTAVSGGGVWMDNGPHALDLARHLVGELHYKGADRWQCDGSLETEVALRFESATGAPVNIALSWERVLGEAFAILHCANGALSLGWHATTWTPYGEAPRLLAGAYDKAACFAAQWRAFGEEDARWNAEDGGEVVTLLEEVYAEARRAPLQVVR